MMKSTKFLFLILKKEIILQAETLQTNTAEANFLQKMTPLRLGFSANIKLLREVTL